MLYKLLIVDDEEPIRLGIAEGIAWADYGFEVCGTAANGIEALELCHQQKPDMILFDINMPYMDGIQFSRQAVTLLPNSVFIVLSGYSEFEYAKAALQIGAFDYLLKPIDPETLVEAIIKGQVKLEQQMRFSSFLMRFSRQLYQELQIQQRNGNALALKVASDSIDLIFVQHPNKSIQQQKEFISLLSHIRENSSHDTQDLSFQYNAAVDLISSESSSYDAQEIKEAILLYLRSCIEASSVSNSQLSREEISLVKRYIDSNLSNSLNLDRLAKNVFLNPNYLASLFKHETGDTIGNYIQKIRLKKAKQLLRKTDLKISAIAEMTGYSNANYFGYVFKKSESISPSDFRHGLIKEIIGENKESF